MWEIIEFHLKKKGWTRYRLAKEAKCGESSLAYIQTGKSRNPGIAILFRISEALEFDINEFKPYFIPEGDDLKN
ncbi:helix-turn-helix domain-containing protein [Aerococcaceae bacterium NML160702]|nr:helix-turn-helix domain-containing protein [Aerococcaceae bacterium NML160702]